MEKFKNIFLIFLVVFLTSLAWKGILGQAIEGEGFYYFSPTLSFISPAGKMASLWGYDNFPVFSTYILERIFGGNMAAYMRLEFITLPLMAIAIYLFVKKITGKNFIALLCAILVCINFPGLFQLVGRGHYAWFLQRIPQIFLILPSWWFFYKFTQKGNVKNYLISLVLFALGILSNHYTSLYTTFYPALLFSNLFFLKNKRPLFKNVVNSAIVLLPFLIANAIIISKTPLAVSNYRPDEGFVHFLLNPQNWFDKLLYHLTVVTLPTNAFVSFYKKPIDLELLIRNSTVPVLGFYSIVLLYLYKVKVKYFNFVVAIFLTLLSVVFLNIFLNQFDVYTEILQGRYYFIPTIYTGIILGSFFGTLYVRGGKFFVKPAILALILVWIFTNTRAISTKIAASQPTYDKIKSGLEFLEKNKNTLPQNAIIVLPSPLMPIGGDFYAKFYAPPGATFYYTDSEWRLKVPENYPAEKIFVFEFDKVQKYQLVRKGL